jgi:SAM-dependent methyltransferase
MRLNYYSRRRFRAMAAAVVGQTVLDIGCTAEPNPYLRGREVVGFDRDPMPVEPPYTEHIVGDVYGINERLRGRVFDTLVLGDFIEHVERPFDVLRMLHRHVAPGGRLVLATPNLIALPIIITEYLNLRFYYTEAHTYCFSPRWMWRIIDRCGFRRVATKGCGIAMPNGWWIPAPAMLSCEVIFVAQRIDDCATGGRGPLSGNLP